MKSQLESLQQALLKLTPKAGQARLGLAREGQESPEDWLHENEVERVRKFATEKRRAEFAIGRIAAKRARGLPCDEARACEISNEISGAPYYFDRQRTLSITHSHGLALAVCGPPAISIDAEALRPQAPDGLRFFLRPEERPSFERLSSEALAHAALAAWCLKEAAYKALTPARGHSVYELRILELCDAGLPATELCAGPLSVEAVGRLGEQAEGRTLRVICQPFERWLVGFGIVVDSSGEDRGGPL